MLRFRDHNDALAAHTDWRRYISEAINPTARGWLGDRNARYGIEAMMPSAIGFRFMVRDTVSAETCWMSHEMMDLVQHAMEGFDRRQEFTVEDAFIPHGFLVLPEPWLSADVHGKSMAQRAMLWKLDEHGAVRLGDSDDDTISYTYDTRLASEPGASIMPTLRITTLSHTWDEDDYTAEYADQHDMLKAAGIEWGVAHTTAIPLPLVSRVGDVGGEGDPQAGWLTFWRVTQALMAETIVTSERRKAARPVRREAQRLGYDFGAPRVIELRRPRQHEADPEGERVRDVNWTHRWIVRGHWRQQWYPSLKGHRQRWIGAYEKGPDNLPLVIRERVWNWDR